MAAPRAQTSLFSWASDWDMRRAPDAPMGTKAACPISCHPAPGAAHWPFSLLRTSVLLPCSLTCLMLHYPTSNSSVWNKGWSSELLISPQPHPGEAADPGREVQARPRGSWPPPPTPGELCSLSAHPCTLENSFLG